MIKSVSLKHKHFILKWMQHTPAVLYFKNDLLACSLGQNGVVDPSLKREGDLKTPTGKHKILYGYYRADRLEKPVTGVPFYPLEPNWGWCDDPDDSSYNQKIILPHGAKSFEYLWREDHLYDLLLVTDYNMMPCQSYKGSAIFVHIEDHAVLEKQGLMPSAGCLKMHLEDLLLVLSCVEDGDTLWWHVHGSQTGMENGRCYE